MLPYLTIIDTRNRFGLVALIFLILNISRLETFAQKIDIGISVNPLWDRDWNTPLYNNYFYSFGAIQHFKSSPINFGLLLERKFRHFSPSLGINILNRRLYNYITLNSYFSYGYLSFTGIEVPISINYRKQLKYGTYFFSSMGFSIDYFLTNKVTDYLKASITSSNPGQPLLYDSTLYIFNINFPKQVTWSSNASIGIENDFGKIGRLQIKIQWHYQFQSGITYTSIYRRRTNSYNFDSYGRSSPFKASYIMLGLTYYLPKLHKKTE